MRPVQGTSLGSPPEHIDHWGDWVAFSHAGPRGRSWQRDDRPWPSAAGAHHPVSCCRCRKSMLPGCAVRTSIVPLAVTCHYLFVELLAGASNAGFIRPSDHVHFHSQKYRSSPSSACWVALPELRAFAACSRSVDMCYAPAYVLKQESGGDRLGGIHKSCAMESSRRHARCVDRSALGFRIICGTPG